MNRCGKGLRHGLVAGLLLGACIALPRPSGAQDGSQEDFLSQYAATYRFTLGRPTAFHPLDDGSAVLFLRSGPRSFVRDLYELDAATGRERMLVSAQSVLKGAEEALSPEERARRERQRSAARGIATYDVSEDGRRILVPLAGRLFVVERGGGKVRELKAAAGPVLDPRFSPDGHRVAYVRAGELCVCGADDHNDRERCLSAGASSTVVHGLAEFVAQEEMGRMRGYWWSPDSRRLAYQRTEHAGMEEFHIADSVHPERPPQAWPYPRAGGKNAEVRLAVVSAEGGPATSIEWDRVRYPYLAAVTWERGAPLSFLVQDRAQREELLLAAELPSGATRLLLKESDPAWVNLEEGMPRWLDGGKGFLWSTDRHGGWSLELRGPDGSLVRQLAGPDSGYRSLAGVDEAAGHAYFLGSPEPVQRQLWRVALDGSAPAQRLSSESGVHSAAFARRGGLHVRSARLLAGGQRSAVHRADGSLAGEVGSLAEKPPLVPQLELSDTGPPRYLRAALIRPGRFRPGRKYPVLVSVYGGPLSQTVTAERDRYLLQQWLADQGFVVVSLDGRGTPGRGWEWERAVRGNLADRPLEDQAEGLAALGRKFPELDLGRVGIYGWSFGGYLSALAAMRRGDLFKAAVAGAPVADWRDYDTHYTERYLGLPEENPAGYKASSALEYAGGLERPLLIIHGTTDDNVYFLHSLKLSDALFRAGKRHEFLPLAGFTHMVPDPLVTRRLYGRIAEFFREKLKP